MDAGPVSVVSFNREMADAAAGAFARFGRGSEQAALLDFGDRLAYALSAVLRAPLLFTGRDFALTDVNGAPGLGPGMMDRLGAGHGLAAPTPTPAGPAPAGVLPHTMPSQKAGPSVETAKSLSTLALSLDSGMVRRR